jgi:hypothetical protein
MDLFRKKKPDSTSPARPPSFPDASQEHQFQMPGLDVVISHSLRVVWVLDTSGVNDDSALLELEEHLKKQGYLLFHTSTLPDPKTPPTPKT